MKEAQGKEGGLQPGEDPQAPACVGLPYPPPLCEGEGGDRASVKGDLAVGLGRDEGFPWQPLLACSQGSFVNFPIPIPVDLEAGIPESRDPGFRMGYGGGREGSWGQNLAFWKGTAGYLVSGYLEPLHILYPDSSPHLPSLPFPHWQAS